MKKAWKQQKAESGKRSVRKSFLSIDNLTMTPGERCDAVLFGFMAAFLVAVILYNVFPPYSWTIIQANEQVETSPGELHSGTTVRQTYPLTEKIQKLSIMFATYMRQNFGKIQVRILGENSGTVYYSGSIDASKLKDNSFVDFILRKTADPSLDPVLSVLITADSPAGNGATIRSSETDTVPGGVLTINDIQLSGDFVYTASSRQISAGGICLLLLSSFLAGQLVYAAYIEIRYGKKRISAAAGLCKILFSVMLCIKAAESANRILYVVVGFLELSVISYLTAALAVRNKKIAWTINVILQFAINMQFFFLWFASSFLSLIMVTNIHSITALSGAFHIYIPWIAAIVGFSCLPCVSAFPGLPLRPFPAAAVTMAAELLLLLAVSPAYSPMYSYGVLISDGIRFSRQGGHINGEASGYFSKKAVEDGIRKPEVFPEQPNIIVLFTEGLSRSVIHDPRNIMPNLRAYEDKSLHFSGYFNHTFATYRGIIGQLYSGYQVTDTSENHLISLHSILHETGYDTTFINVEPENPQFTKYLGSMGFDHLISDSEMELKGTDNSVSDADAYAYLFEMMQEKHKEGVPFFIGMYTFGTHASFDSVDAVFGDGSDPELNKFYNLDLQFGEFMKAFTNSPLAGDTIVIFTTDHASYVDEFYKHAFPTTDRGENEATMEADEIPFLIYFDGLEPQEINVNGRNSLGFAPTILDLMDVSAPNYFLGTSLFSSIPGDCEYLFHQPSFLAESRDSEIVKLSGSQDNEYWEILDLYFSAALA